MQSSRTTITFLAALFFLGACALVNAQTIEEAKGLESAFEKVASEVGPAVVSISIEHVEKYPFRQYYRFGQRENAPFDEDEFFDQFFKEFFGEIPQLEQRQMGLGSGVIIDPNGYVLTNEHVVEGADKITVTLPDGRSFKGEVKGIDPRSDLAIVRIKAKDLPYAKLGDSDKVRIGQWSIAIGNPFGYAVRSPKPTVTVGVISALNRALPRTSARDRDYTDLMQTDAAINPGNSGGPLVNIDGEVIGINVAIFSTTGGYQGIGFAIPINNAKRIVQSLIQGKKIVYGWLGINIQDIDEDLARFFGLPDKEGVLVMEIVKGSPADKAGLQNGDIVRTFDGNKVSDARGLLKHVGESQVGKRITLGILRDKKELNMVVEVGQRPEDVSPLAKKEEEAVGGTATWRGMSVQDAESAVVVSGVEANSPAFESGIRSGDLINELNRTPVTSVSEFSNATKNVSGDCLIRTNRGYAVVKEKAGE